MVNMATAGSLVVFALGEVRFALSTSVIERVVRAVEVSPIPDAPPGVTGVINLHGRVLPVLEIRPRFGLEPREIQVSDHLVIVHAGEGTVALAVDAPVDVVSAEEANVLLPKATLGSFGLSEAMMVHGENVVSVQDPGRFLTPELRDSGELKLVA